MSTAAEQTSEGIDNLRANRDALKQQLDELTGKYRNLQATTVFKEAQLDPKHAELFLKVHDAEADITADSVKAFATEYKLAPVAPPAAPEGQKPPANPNQPEGVVQQPNPDGSALAGMAGAGSSTVGANPPSSPGTKLSQADFQKLMSTDKDAAIQAYVEGRVQTSEGNVFVDQAKRAGVME